MKNTLLPISLALLCTGCTLGTPIDDATIPSNSSSTVSSIEVSSSSVTTTELRGMVEPVGITVYQQGTHKITLDSGRIVLLESSTVDLNGYVGTVARLTGVIRATVEADGQIMNVQTIALDDSTSSSSETSSSSSTSSSDSTMSKNSTSSVSLGTSTVQSSTLTSVSSSSSVQTSVSSVSSVSDARVQTMLKANLSPENWTQNYCSKQTSVCITVHKNWWYTGFGANATATARIDIGPDEIETIGDGVIVVTVEKGTASSGAGGYTALKQFDGEFVRVTGPADLKAAIDYIASSARKSE